MLLAHAFMKSSTAIRNRCRAPSGPSGFDYTVERKERMIYFSSLLQRRDGELLRPDSNDDSGFCKYGQLAIWMQPQWLRAHRRSLEVALQGVTEQSHLVHVVFNGVDLGTMNFANTDHPVETFTVPANGVSQWQQHGRADFAGWGCGRESGRHDRLTYAHSYAADNNALLVSIDSEDTKRVSGFTSSNMRVD